MANWFLSKVLEKDSRPVPSGPNWTNTDLGTDGDPENLMDKGFCESVPIVPSVPSKRRSPKVLSEIEEVKNWMIRTGRPQEDYLFRLIMEKCENDSEARQHFLEYSRTRKAQNDEAEEPATRVMDLDFSPVSVKTQDIGDWENLINRWLDHIGEHDPELRNTCLNQCRRDPEARKYFLSHAILEFRKSKRESND